MDTVTMPKPSHTEALGLWEMVCKATNKDSVLLVLPTPTAIACTAFRPTEVTPLEELMEDSIHNLIDNEVIRQECPWGVLVAPSFHKVMTPWQAEDPEHGDLQAAYIAGDQSVREIVLVIIMEMDGPPIGQSFSQPLLEPLDEPDIMAPGPMTLSLMNVLMHAAFPEDFKDA